MNLKERFDAKVECFDGGCWFWLAHLLPTGYGQIRADGQAKLAHRISYELHVGPIPKGLHLDHLCRNPSCVNPAHLEPVTVAENVRRGLAGVLRETCDRGHPWIPENWASNGDAKTCAVCKRERETRRRKRIRGESVTTSPAYRRAA